MSLRRVTLRDDVAGLRRVPGEHPGHEELFGKVDAVIGRPCSSCGKELCGHEALACVVFRLDQRPRCICCLASSLATTPDVLLSDLRTRMARRNCHLAAWKRASDREGRVCAWTGARKDDSDPP